MTPSAAAGRMAAAAAAGRTRAASPAPAARAPGRRAVARRRGARRRAVTRLARPILRCAGLRCIGLRRTGLRRIAGTTEPSISVVSRRLRCRRQGILVRRTLIPLSRTGCRGIAGLGSRISEAPETAAIHVRSGRCRAAPAGTVHRRGLRRRRPSLAGRLPHHRCVRPFRPGRRSAASLLHGVLLLGEGHPLRRGGLLMRIESGRSRRPRRERRGVRGELQILMAGRDSDLSMHQTRGPQLLPGGMHDAAEPAIMEVRRSDSCHAMRYGRDFCIHWLYLH